jgi:uncharacterized zinc-type alcohol dehydrogenase-like protein
MLGEENICLQGYTGTMLGGNAGTFAKKVRINERFAYPIPASLDPIRIAPALCAGMTVYQPLRRYLKFPGMRVGVVGIGGLGHYGVKFARAMGAEVTVFSTSADKKDEAVKFGAHNFVHTGDEAAMKAQVNTQDMILDTVPVPVNWSQYFGILRPGGVLCLVGVPVDTIPIPTIPLVFGQRSVVGSIVSGGTIMSEMLNFCALNQIYPDVEVFDFKDINAASDRCLAGKARYRIVLKW